MDVAVTALRSDLKHYLALARGGEDVVITDRGSPVARLVGMDYVPLLDRLTRDGVISPPASAERPKASGRPRPRSRRPLSDIVIEQRG